MLRTQPIWPDFCVRARGLSNFAVICISPGLMLVRSNVFTRRVSVAASLHNRATQFRRLWVIFKAPDSLNLPNICWLGGFRRIGDPRLLQKNRRPTTDEWQRVFHANRCLWKRAILTVYGNRPTKLSVTSRRTQTRAPRRLRRFRWWPLLGLGAMSDLSPQRVPKQKFSVSNANCVICGNICNRGTHGWIWVARASAKIPV